MLLSYLLFFVCAVFFEERVPIDSFGLNMDLLVL